MPTVNNDALYNAVYEVAAKRFAQDLADYGRTVNSGDPLYRYVSYRNNMPQAENAGRTIFTSLENDTGNRWTGRGPDGNGRQGLYMSAEFVNEGYPFPELEHYQQPDGNPDANITYFDYTGGELGPVPESVSAGQLRSMFLFTSDQDMQGLDLRLNGDNGQPNLLIEEIFNTARERYPDLFQGQTLEGLYTHGEDASFCRAIGNACLEKTDVTYFETTSVRDHVSSNIIIRGDGPDPAAGRAAAPINDLTPQGRASFFAQGDNVGQGVFTVSDMLYNATFEQPGAGNEALPNVETFTNSLFDLANNSVDALTSQFNTMLNEQPPNDNLEALTESIANLRTNINERNLQETLTQLEEVQTQVDNLRANQKNGLNAIQRTAVDVVDSVSRSLSDMARAIENAQDRAENPDHEVPENTDIEDPSEHDLDPVIPEH